VNTSEMLVSMSAGSLEDFYPAIAIAILMRYIRDPSLSQHHRTVVQAITFIFKSLGSKCIPYLLQVVPAYLHVIRASEVIFREVPYFVLYRIANMKRIHIHMACCGTSWMSDNCSVWLSLSECGTRSEVFYLLLLYFIILTFH